MNTRLTQDRERLDELLQRTVQQTDRFLSGLDQRAAGVVPPVVGSVSHPTQDITTQGIGAEAALDLFNRRYEPWLSGSAGPRYFGFVTGGVTPAALMGDWLTSTYDQNAFGSSESIAAQIELDTLAMLRALFGLPETFSGIFVTGATVSNFVGLTLARQWIGHQHGMDVAQQGAHALPSIRVLSGAPHASIYKALSMAGLGRSALHPIATKSAGEAVDLAALEEALQKQEGMPSIVVANAGTVNTVDFDDLTAIATLREKYSFWLHIDGAFGGFAACSPQYSHYVAGMELADSLTIDAHKWLNVPYDAAMHFTRHPQLQRQIFQNAAAYLGTAIEAGDQDFIHRTPENSRRLRALAAWFSLTAYGKTGYREIVERNCSVARWFGQQIAGHDAFQLLAPVRLNGVCFTLTTATTMADIQSYLDLLQSDGRLFLTATLYQEMPAIRISVTNWRTTQDDAEIAWQAMVRCLRE